nr:hypothetical protein [Tanacetum cinerariifolium]
MKKLLPIRDKRKIPTHGGRATGYSLWQRSVMVVGFWLWLGFKCGRVLLVEGRGGGDSDGGVDGGEVVVVVENLLRRTMGANNIERIESIGEVAGSGERSF